MDVFFQLMGAIFQGIGFVASLLTLAAFVLSSELRNNTQRLVRYCYEYWASRIRMIRGELIHEYTFYDKDSAFIPLRRGGLEIPVMPITIDPGEPYSESEVIMEYLDREHSVSLDNDSKDRIIEFASQPNFHRNVSSAERSTLRYRKLKELGLKNNPILRLFEWKQGYEGESNSKGILCLMVGKTMYFDYLCTNFSLDLRNIPKLRPSTLREKNVENPEKFVSNGFSALPLSNPISVFTTLILRDLSTGGEWVVLHRRSDDVYVARNCYTTSGAGFMVPVDKDAATGLLSPFKAATRELREETWSGITDDKGRCLLVGFGRNWLDMCPHLYFVFEMEGDSSLLGEVISGHRRDGHESSRKEILEFSPSVLISHIAGNAWTASGAYAIISALLYRFSEDEVNSACRKVRKDGRRFY